MFVKKLEYLFLTIIVLAAIVLVHNWYESYEFDTNPLPKAYQQSIISKKHEIMQRMEQAYGIHLDVPIIISDKLGGRRYGVTTYVNGRIRIYLNKKVMKESMEYILEDVIAHEYAHALMFHLGRFDGKDGHTLQWQQACRKLGGSRCDRFVDHDDVIMGKLPF